MIELSGMRRRPGRFRAKKSRAGFESVFHKVVLAAGNFQKSGATRTGQLARSASSATWNYLWQPL
jgi:hypothetical protein